MTSRDVIVSVVIPTYRRPEMTLQAVNSVLAQTFPSFEVLVVDDGSPEPVEVNLQDERVKILRHTRNLGPAAARNTGIKNARGEFIAFLDSDDLWLPDKLLRQYELMEKNHSSASVTSFEYDTEEGYKVIRLKKPKNWLRELAKECKLAPGSTLMVRRSCYERTGYYNESMPRHEDYDWLLRFISSYDIDVLEEPMSIVKRSGLASGESMEAANRMIIEQHGARFLSLGRFFGSWVIGRRLLETGVHYAVEGKKGEAFRYMMRAAARNPFQSPWMYLRVIERLLGLSFFQPAKRQALRVVRFLTFQSKNTSGQNNEGTH